MHCDLLTIFPELIEAVSSHSMMKRAQDKRLLTIQHTIFAITPTILIVRLTTLPSAEAAEWS